MNSVRFSSIRFGCNRLEGCCCRRQLTWTGAAHSTYKSHKNMALSVARRTSNRNKERKKDKQIDRWIDRIVLWGIFLDQAKRMMLLPNQAVGWLVG